MTTTERKVIKAKVGLLELAKQPGQRDPGLPGDGEADQRVPVGAAYWNGQRRVFARQLLSVPRPLRKRRRSGAGRDHPVQAQPEEPRRAGGGGGCGRDGRRSTGLGPGAGRQRVEEAWHRGLAVRGPLHLAAPRPGDDEEAAESPGGQGRAGWRRADREPVGGARKSQAGQGSPWRVRQRTPRLLPGAGHVLCRHTEGWLGASTSRL